MYFAFYNRLILLLLLILVFCISYVSLFIIASSFSLLHFSFRLFSQLNKPRKSFLLFPRLPFLVLNNILYFFCFLLSFFDSVYFLLLFLLHFIFFTYISFCIFIFLFMGHCFSFVRLIAFACCTFPLFFSFSYLLLLLLIFLFAFPFYSNALYFYKA